MSNIAHNIIKQIGGTGRLSAMINAKDFLAHQDGLSFKWTAKSRNKSNYIKIVLNGNDLYDITFGYTRGLNYTVRSEHKDVYFDELISLFERETGLFLSL